MRQSGSKRASKMRTGAVELIECRARFISWWWEDREERLQQGGGCTRLLSRYSCHVRRATEAAACPLELLWALCLCGDTRAFGQ